MFDVKTDRRFAHIAKDQRFRRMKRTDRKLQIGSRFKGVFQDKKFTHKYTVDQRGRPVRGTSNDDLKRFYDLEDSDDDDDEDEKEKEKEKEVEKEDGDEDEGSDNEGSDNEDSETAQKESKRKFDLLNGPDYARGEGLDSSDEESEEEGEDVEQQEESDDDGSSSDGSNLTDTEDITHQWAELDKDAVQVEEATRRLAVCNMDWDRIKANDLLMVLNSYKPTGGLIKSVKIYPSEYGLQRMKEENLSGPQELVAATNKLKKKKNIEELKEGEEGSVYHREKLRVYQMNRLRYYYAVVECDSPNTADAIYKECDGVEYESSGTTFDCRFIPDDMTFDDQKPKSEVYDVPKASLYNPTLFTNAAMQQSKVDLTWDETDPDRLKFTMREFDKKEDLEALDLKNYLASDSEPDDGEDPYAGLEDPDFGPCEEMDKEKMIADLRALVSTDGDKKTPSASKDTGAGLDDSEEEEEEEDEDSEAGEESDKESDDEDQMMAEFKAIVKSRQGDKKNKKDMDMEVTWQPDIVDKMNQRKQAEAESQQDLTPFDKYLKKKAQKKKDRKAEIKKRKRGEVEESDDDDDDDDDDEDDIPEDVDLNDPYFKQLDEEFEDEPKGKGKKKEKKDNNKKEKNKRKKYKPEELTPEEEEAKRQREAELELIMMDEDDQRAHFSLKAIQEKEEEETMGKRKKKRKMNQKKKMKEAIAAKKAKKSLQDDFEINVSDPRFSAIYTNPRFHIDPTSHEFKKTKGMEKIIEENLRRKAQKSGKKSAKKSSS